MIILLFSAFALSRAQDPVAPDSVWRNLAPKLFLQDQTGGDVNFVKTKVTFVNYVRTPEDAEILLTVTASSTGGGGYEFTLSFVGRGRFGDLCYSLRHTTRADATSDETRSALVAAIKRGLAPFIHRTGLRPNLAIEFNPPTEAAPATDPWQSWVFTISAYGALDGERDRQSLNPYLSIDVGRVTEGSKFLVSAGAQLSRDRYTLEDGILTAVSSNSWGSLGYARKLSRHLAVSGELSYSSANYNNIRHGLAASPGLEYALTPYSEYARHKVSLIFKPALKYRQYYDTTVYDRLREMLFGNALQLSITATRPWGSLTAYASGQVCLPDVTINRFSLLAFANFNIVGGLSLSLTGHANMIHDQISLRKDWATEQERLLRLRELKTSYNYYASVGLSYTFGSIYSNVVNPIF